MSEKTSVRASVASSSNSPTKASVADTTRNNKAQASAVRNELSVNASSNLAQYYSNLSRDYAFGVGIINHEDYSSKTYALQSKDSANDAKSTLEQTRVLANETIEQVESTGESIVSSLNELEGSIRDTANVGLSQLAESTEQALNDLETASEEILENVEANSRALPMFTPIWSDHLYNDVSYLRADTFSWHSGYIYKTAYEVLLNEYNNENCIEETENGVTYKRSPSGFKIANVEQNDVILDVYNNTGIAWYYIIDVVNMQFKLPRTKWGFVGNRDEVGRQVDPALPSIYHTHTRGTMNIEGTISGRGLSADYAGSIANASGAFTFTKKGSSFSGSPVTLASDSYKGDLVTFNASRNWTGSTSENSTVSNIYGKSDTVQPPATQMYLYFYVGNYARPDTDIQLGILTEIVNGMDLDLIVGEINNARDTGVTQVSNATQTGLTSVSSSVTSGLNNISSASTTGVNNITQATNTGVSTINDTTNKGKAELNKIVADKIPPATVDTLGLVKPDGVTVMVTEDGTISASGSSDDVVTLNTEQTITANKTFTDGEQVKFLTGRSGYNGAVYGDTNQEGSVIFECQNDSGNIPESVIVGAQGFGTNYSRRGIFLSHPSNEAVYVGYPNYACKIQGENDLKLYGGYSQNSFLTLSNNSMTYTKSDGSVVDILTLLANSGGGDFNTWEVQKNGNSIALYNPDLRLKFLRISVNLKITIKKTVVVSQTYYLGDSAAQTYPEPFVYTPLMIGRNLLASGVNGAVAGVKIDNATNYVVTGSANAEGTISVTGYFLLLGVI